jgi:hypothetical protein
VASARFRLAFTERLTVIATWLVSPSGEVAFDIEANGDLDLPPLLRIGIELELGGGLEHVRWFGPGPEESYSDRVGGLPVGHHQSTVAGQFFPYARPQETGNHTACRWFAVADADGRGLVAVGDEWFDASALHARHEDLAVAHPHEISWRDTTVVRLDAAHSGLGTASCGPGLNPAHVVQPYHVRKRIVLRSFEGDPLSVARRSIEIPRPRRWHYG